MANLFNGLMSEFPYLKELDSVFYKKEPYAYCSNRRSKLIIIYGAMRNYDKFRELDQEAQNQYIQDIETSCYNYAIQKARVDNINREWTNPKFVKPYDFIISEKAHALNINNNTYLIPNLLEGRLWSYDIGKMSVEELDPEKNENVLKKIHARRTQKIESKTSILYECEKCHHKETIMSQMQARSSDEGKDLQALCIFCGHFWTIQN